MKNYPEIGGEICAVGAQRLFVHGDGPDGNQLYGTWDAGQTFKEISLAPPPAAGQANYPGYACPHFLDARIGYETVTFDGGDDIPSVTVLFTTTDGGHTWTSTRTLGNLMGGTLSIPSTIIDSSWVIPFRQSKGTPSLMKLPLSPGQTSAPAYHVGDLSGCSLSFWGASTGWASCGSGLSSTDDGGTTWTAINPRIVHSTGTLTSAPVTPSPASRPPLQPLITPRFQAVPRPQPPTASVAGRCGLRSGRASEMGT